MFYLLQVDIPSCFVGLVLENCELPHSSHGHVVLADPSPILLYPISSTEVRCLVDVPGQKVPSITNGDMAKHLRTVVAPQVITCPSLDSFVHGLNVCCLCKFSRTLARVLEKFGQQWHDMPFPSVRLWKSNTPFYGFSCPSRYRLRSLPP